MGEKPETWSLTGPILGCPGTLSLPFEILTPPDTIKYRSLFSGIKRGGKCGWIDGEWEEKMMVEEGADNGEKSQLKQSPDQGWAKLGYCS